MITITIDYNSQTSLYDVSLSPPNDCDLEGSEKSAGSLMGCIRRVSYLLDQVDNASLQNVTLRTTDSVPNEVENPLKKFVCDYTEF